MSFSFLDFVRDDRISIANKTNTFPVTLKYFLTNPGKNCEHETGSLPYVFETLIRQHIGKKGSIIY